LGKEYGSFSSFSCSAPHKMGNYAFGIECVFVCPAWITIYFSKQH
jgi:hypothetical protein